MSVIFDERLEGCVFKFYLFLVTSCGKFPRPCAVAIGIRKAHARTSADDEQLKCTVNLYLRKSINCGAREVLVLEIKHSMSPKIAGQTTE